MDEKQLEQYLEEVYRLEEEILGEYDEDWCNCSLQEWQLQLSFF